MAAMLEVYNKRILIFEFLKTVLNLQIELKPVESSQILAHDDSASWFLLR